MPPSPKLTRREFQAGAGSLLLGGALVVPLADAAAGAEGSLDQAPAVDATGACDFQRSFMTWDFPFRPDPRPHARHNIPHGNMARILLDAMLDVIDRQTGVRPR